MGDSLNEPSHSNTHPGGLWHHDLTSKHAPPPKLHSCHYGETRVEGTPPLQPLIPEPAPTQSS